MADLSPDIDLIRLHCGDITARIRACRSRTVAIQLQERMCHELQQHCPSAVVQNMLSRHVERIMADTFDENGMNKFLEA